jgi:DNA repair exonuclease SbcCD ATPase subunit
MAPDSYAQSGNPAAAGAKSDQVIRELLSEVHQLRVAMQHVSVNAYRGQIMVERLRLQQDQVGRLTRDLQDVRNEIVELKAHEPMAKERLDDAENKFESGFLPDMQMKEIRANYLNLKRRQQGLSEREILLSNELQQERNKLAELNERLDAFEREVMMTLTVNEAKKDTKQ